MRRTPDDRIREQLLEAALPILERLRYRLILEASRHLHHLDNLPGNRNEKLRIRLRGIAFAQILMRQQLETAILEFQRTVNCAPIPEPSATPEGEETR